VVATFAEHIAALTRIEGAAVPGAEEAANAMADVFRPAVQSVLLARRHGFATKTPSAPGEPPAAISGRLAASVVNEGALPVGPAAFMAKSGPTTVYSRIQELGGWMQGHPEMHWMEPPGHWHYSRGHSLPPRPYMKPTLEMLEGDGTLEDAAAAAFDAAFQAVI
jgi:hypothetical protein